MAGSGNTFCRISALRRTGLTLSFSPLFDQACEKASKGWIGAGPCALYSWVTGDAYKIPDKPYLRIIQRTANAERFATSPLLNPISAVY